MVRRNLTYALLLLCGMSVPANALRFYVNPSTGDNRRSHIVAQADSTAWRTITHALEMAHLITQGRPHVIDIASGTYSPASGETFPFVISQTNIYLQSQGSVVLDAQRKSRILQVTAPTSDFVLRNFSLVNGVADRGGAVSCETCTLRVVDSRLLSNEASEGGDAIYVANGRLQLINNNIRFNGVSGDRGAVVEVRNTFTDTSKRDVIRNNTFYRNNKPTILTTGNRVDISSNILVGNSGSGIPAIVDSAAGIEPAVRYNLFWQTDIMYLSNSRDTVDVARTVRDTLSLADQGVAVPTFVTNIPDTVAQIGSLYEFDIALETAKSNYKFTVINGGDIPVGMSEETIESSGILRWTPTATQTGQHAVRVEIIRQTPPVKSEFLSYLITVFTAEDFPDTTTPADVITVTSVADTSGGVDSLNTIVPVFSKAASAGGNQYGDPLFLNTEINRFELLALKARTIIPTGDTIAVPDTVRTKAIDFGDPIVLFNDAVLSGGQVRNDIGASGGPTNGGPGTPGTTAERAATGLPDSVAVEGQVWTYDPVLSPAGNVLIIDLIQGAPTMGSAFGSGDGKTRPATWTPALADTGKFLVGVQTFYSGGSARHYFPLRVRAANARPRITTTAPTTATEDVPFVYEIGAVDDDGDTISFSVTSGPDGMTVDSLGVVRWTPAQADVGSVDAIIGITDSGGAVNSHAMTLQVSNSNDAPVLVALSDTAATEDVLFQLPLSATDEDVADSSFTFTVTTGPDSVSIDAQNRLTWTPVQADVGAHTLTVQVADTGGAVDSVSFQVSVIEVDDPPTISSTPDSTAPEDALYQYAVAAADEESDTLAYSLVTAPTGMSIDSLGVVSWTPALADTGQHTVSLLVADAGGQTAAQSYQLQVVAVNDPPVILSRTPADTLVLVDPGQSVSFELSSEDEEGDLLTLQWLVDGSLKSSASSFVLVPDTTSADTVVANLSDGTNTTSTMWIVDARAIAKVSVATDTVDFGSVGLGDTASVVLMLRNPGRTTLNISDLQVGNLAFTATFGSDAITLRDSTTLTLSFVAATRGARSSTVQFSTNDPDLPLIVIPLTAVAVVPTTVALDANPLAGDQGVRTGTGRIGDTAVVDLEALEALDLASYGVELTFDPAILSLQSFTADGSNTNLLGAGLTSVVSEPAAGTVRVDVTGTSPVSGDGALGRWTFAVAASATAHVSSQIALSRVELLSSGQAAADTLTGAGVTLQITNPLSGDGNGDGVINFDDFFLFADDFGTSTPRSDYNSDGTVDFTDFFLFADFFNTANARPLPIVKGSLEGLAVAVDSRPSSTERVDMAVHWQAEDNLRGAGLWVSWDPRDLVFVEASADNAKESADRVLVWARADAEAGRLELAAAPVAGTAFGVDVATLRFRRLTSGASQIRVDAAIGRDRDGTTQSLNLPAAANVVALPSVAVLYPAHPNPFNPETVIPFFIPSGADAHVDVRIFDLLGRRVRTLTSGAVTGGHHRLVWHGRDDAGRQAGAGVYLVELRTGSHRQVRKVMLLK